MAIWKDIAYLYIKNKQKRHEMNHVFFIVPILECCLEI